MKSILLSILFAVPLSVMAETITTPSSLKTELVGHRGSPEEAPENTVASFKLAYSQGADGCELDMKTTKDQRIVINHDGDTKRCAGVDKPVIEQTVAELQALDLGQGEKWKGKDVSAKMPTLEEALATVPAGRKMFLHCYFPRKDIEKIKEPILQSKLTPAQVMFISFDLEACKIFKKHMPKFKAYWLQGAKKSPNGEMNTIEDLIKQAKAAGIDGLDLAVDFSIDKAFVDKVHRAGLELHTFTVDDAAIARKLVEAGVDSITTNRPGWLREQLKRAK